MGAGTRAVGWAGAGRAGASGGAGETRWSRVGRHPGLRRSARQSRARRGREDSAGRLWCCAGQPRRRDRGKQEASAARFSRGCPCGVSARSVEAESCCVGLKIPEGQVLTGRLPPLLSPDRHPPIASLGAVEVKSIPQSCRTSWGQQEMKFPGGCIGCGTNSCVLD